MALTTTDLNDFALLKFLVYKTYNPPAINFWILKSVTGKVK